MAKSTKSLNLFATKEDWSRLLAVVEGQITVAYVLGGRHTEPPSRIDTYQMVENLGCAHSGNASSEQSYLCIPNDTEHEFRHVEQRNGGYITVVDQKSNPDSIALKTGGTFGKDTIIAGQIGTVSDAEWSLQTFFIFQKEVRKQFEKIKSYYVGKEARTLLDEGWRLTANARSPRQYDLSLG